MSETESPSTGGVFEPTHPALLAAAILSIGIIILALPMLGGNFLAGPWSDQYAVGVAYRDWGSAQWIATGSVPLWNPTLFGGVPFVAAMHGDILYPTSFLRLLLPTITAMNLSFVLHYFIAGFFTYVLLRKLSVSWTGAVVGGFVFQLSGVIGSYVQPGHDGKLFVTALLPVALVALVMAIRERNFQGHALLALTVGAGVLSPQYQMLYYLLIVAGIFALYLTFGEPSDRSMGARTADLGIAFLAVLLGFGIAMIQVLPFYHYIPFSPRAEGYRGFEGSASYALPWSHVGELFLSRFVGDTPHGTYWGGNPLKLHSEYLGLPALALAAMAVTSKARRRLIAWMGGIGVLFMLITLGSGTPFYRVWWELMPYVKQTRAPGMALFVVSFVVAVLAGLGVERIETGEQKPGRLWVAVGVVVAVLGIAGIFGAVADSISTTANLSDQTHLQIKIGAVFSGVALLLLGAVQWLRQENRLPTAVLSILLVGVVSGDLWLNTRPFWVYSDPDSGIFATDEIIETLQQADVPFRTLDLGLFFGQPVYPGAMLMRDDVSQLFGHHGNELNNYDVLMGGKNVWNSIRSPDGLTRLLDLYAVEYVMVPSDVGDASPILPAFDRVRLSVPTGGGATADLYQRRDTLRYARFVPSAVKMPDERAVHTMMLPNFPIDAVITVGDDSGIEPATMESIPDPVPVDVTIDSWQPGKMIASGDTPAGYVIFAENYYPDWRAHVNGEEVQVFRANEAMLAVSVPAGQKTIELEFVSDDYTLGKKISLISLLLVALGFVVPVVMRRR